MRLGESELRLLNSVEATILLQKHLLRLNKITTYNAYHVSTCFQVNIEFV